MNILITGGAGCIGSRLAEKLLENKNNEITILDNLSSGKLEHIGLTKSNKRIKFFEVDILNFEFVQKYFINQDIIFHLAANPDIKYKDGDRTDKDLNQNIICTYNILELMRRHDVKNIVFSSSSAVYGITNKTPVPENYGPMDPISLYGATKLSCESLISGFSHMFGFRSYIFRFSNVVGPRTRKKGTMVIDDFINKLDNNPKNLHILGNGKQSKPYMYVDDCVDGMLFGYKKTSKTTNTFNLGPGDNINVHQIAQIVINEMGLKDVKFSYGGGLYGWPGDIPHVILDVSKINKLGWKTSYTSRQVIEKTVKEILKLKK